MGSKWTDFGTKKTNPPRFRSYGSSWVLSTQKKRWRKKPIVVGHQHPYGVILSKRLTNEMRTLNRQLKFSYKKKIQQTKQKKIHCRHTKTETDSCVLHIWYFELISILKCHIKYNTIINVHLTQMSLHRVIFSRTTSSALIWPFGYLTSSNASNLPKTERKERKINNNVNKKDYGRWINKEDE